jgi:hypothetical protein
MRRCVRELSTGEDDLGRVRRFTEWDEIEAAEAPREQPTAIIMAMTTRRRVGPFFMFCTKPLFSMTYNKPAGPQTLPSARLSCHKMHNLAVAIVRDLKL